MGTWPSKIELAPHDIPEVARVLRAPLLVSCAAVVVLGLRTRTR
jgi:hypothetical protein